MIRVRRHGVDDHPVFRIGMAALLDSLAGISVIGQAAGAAAAGALFATRARHRRGAHGPRPRGRLGVDVTRDLLRADPDLRVLVVTMHEDDDAVVAAVRAGARGYLVKSAPPDAVERAVRAVAAGEMILSPAVAQRAMTYVLGGRTSARLPFPQLTDREREVLDLVAARARQRDRSRAASGSAPRPCATTWPTCSRVSRLPDRSAAIVRAREEGLGTSD